MHRALLSIRFLAKILAYVADNLMWSVRLRLGLLETMSGATHLGRDLGALLAYVEEVFTDYRKYIGAQRFYGRVAELGPGDNSGVAILFLNDGCQAVDLVDRFYSQRDAATNARIYLALAQKYPRLAELLAESDLQSGTVSPAIAQHHGDVAAAETFFETHRGYDFIVSRAVLEHTYDPLGALAKMTAALNSQGVLAHKVDLRDHGMFSAHHHELKYLEVPDWVYPFMTSSAGRPNRVLFHMYRAAVQQLPLHCTFYVTRLAGVGDIIPHVRYGEVAPGLMQQSLDYVRHVRRSFAKSLRGVAAEDLAVAGFFLVARKHAVGGRTGEPTA